MDEMTDSQALHRTVLLTEAADEVSRARNGIFIDATFGRGGHSRAVLARIAPDARLIAFDRDPQIGCRDHRSPLFDRARAFFRNEGTVGGIGHFAGQRHFDGYRRFKSSD